MDRDAALTVCRTGKISVSSQISVCYNMAMNARAHLFVLGHVQGVFYRAFTRSVAARLGLHGWVRNLYDGRVEAVLEGEKSVIEEAIAECRTGPPGAHVSDISVSWEDFQGEFRGFDIRF